MSDKKNADFNYHPIQLREVKVLKLSIEANPEFDEDNCSKEISDFGFYHMHSDYDAEAKAFWVRVKATIGSNDECDEQPEDEQEQSPFHMEVELVGLFSVDESAFPAEQVESFARQNAPLIVYPYLREHVYSLTNRAGFESTLLPLFEVPVFRLQR